MLRSGVGRSGESPRRHAAGSWGGAVDQGRRQFQSAVGPHAHVDVPPLVALSHEAESVGLMVLSEKSLVFDTG